MDHHMVAAGAFSLHLYKQNLCYVYRDEVLIASTNAEEHKQHLQLVFNHFREYGVHSSVSLELHNWIYLL